MNSTTDTPASPTFRDRNDLRLGELRFTRTCRIGAEAHARAWYKPLYTTLALESAAIKDMFMLKLKTVGPCGKGQVANELAKDHQLPFRRACQIVKLSRAAYTAEHHAL